MYLVAFKGLMKDPKIPVEKTDNQSLSLHPLAGPSITLYAAVSAILTVGSQPNTPPKTRSLPPKITGL